MGQYQQTSGVLCDSAQTQARLNHFNRLSGFGSGLFRYQFSFRAEQSDGIEQWRTARRWLCSDRQLGLLDRLYTDSAYFVHFYLVGLIGCPIGWMFIFVPFWQRVAGEAHWFTPSAIYGFGLWVFATGGVTLVAGLPFFLNFIGITRGAVVGHVVCGIVMVAVLKRIDRS